jgi:UDP-N-acetylglucosamine--N-acetylmuramyl-(pentapeptide) pyrophosphoryl-undecaprenol N-acetylglucosamine transferase
MEAAVADLGRPSWVRIVGYIDEMPMALSVTDLAVSRAGAMATSEFLAWGVPAILVPLPTAAEDHQTRNALALCEAGAALCFPEESLTGEILWEAIEALLTEPEARMRMSQAALRRGRPNAAREIASSLERFLPPPSQASGSAAALAGGPS